MSSGLPDPIFPEVFLGFAAKSHSGTAFPNPINHGDLRSP
jgi:hypothetical protein